jgi:hypothetical protein
MTAPRARIKPGRASLIGGIAVGIACFVLWVAALREVGQDTPLLRGAGAMLAAAIGGWIRAADL